MQSAWTKNLRTQEEKDRFQNTLLGSKEILNRLAELLKEKETELDRSEKSLETYANPSWAYKQAHLNGYAAALSYINKLINLDHQKD